MKLKDGEGCQMPHKQKMLSFRRNDKQAQVRIMVRVQEVGDVG